MTVALDPNERPSLRTEFRHLRREVRELKAQVREVRRWVKTATALLVALSASVAGALLSTLLK